MRAFRSNVAITDGKNGKHIVISANSTDMLENEDAFLLLIDLQMIHVLQAQKHKVTSVRDT